jgi:hypothetical protein
MTIRFSILLLEESASEGNELGVWGQITIGSFVERFIAPLGYWSKGEYEEQWNSGISRIIGPHDVSCLITSMRDPATANFIFWWPLYRIGETVYVQNQLVFVEQLKMPFDPMDPYVQIPPRVTLNEEGETVSEWPVPLQAIKDFAAKIRKKT